MLKINLKNKQKKEGQKYDATLIGFAILVI